MDSLVKGLLEEATAAGLQVWVHGDQLRIRGPKIAEPIVSQLVERKPEILEQLALEREESILTRVAAFRTQIPLTGAIPFLTLSPSIAPGTCLSCGEGLADESRSRCDLCAEAARQAIAEIEAMRKSNREAL